MNPRRALLNLLVGGLPLLLLGLLTPRQAASMPTGSLRDPILPDMVGEVVVVTAVLQPTQDNTLYESSAGMLSNGKGQHIFVGRTGGGVVHRGLLAFDVAGAIPSFATVMSATLELHMSRSNAGATDVHLHLLQTGWGEGNSDAVGEEGAGVAAAPGDATWLHTFFNTATWTNPGGDYRATPSASTSVDGTGLYQWHSEQVTADVQQWLGNPAAAYGWILIGNETSTSTSKRFEARENSLVDHRPTLSITYTIALLEKRVYLPSVWHP